MSKVQPGDNVTENVDDTAASNQSLAENADTVTLSKDQFEQLIAVTEEYRNDIIALVSVFQSFAVFLKGDANPLKIGTAIVKLLNNDEAKQRLTNIIPIIEKYTENNG